MYELDANNMFSNPNVANGIKIVLYVNHLPTLYIAAVKLQKQTNKQTNKIITTCKNKTKQKTKIALSIRCCCMASCFQFKFKLIENSFHLQS